MRGVCVFATLLLAFTSMPTEAQDARNLVPSVRSGVKSEFAFPVGVPVRILLFRPDVEVTEETVGGLDQPKADWTEKARTALIGALAKDQNLRTNELQQMAVLTSEEASAAEDYRALFKVIINAAIDHKLYPGNKLPSKAGRFDWTLGPGVGQIAKFEGKNYGFFFYSYDSFPSVARNKSAVIGALMGEAESRGKHVGYAGLIDLKTGDLVWLNTDLRMMGDIRTPVGAARRIAELLKGFPERKVINVDGKTQ
jgi:hypothetical protein